MDRLQDSLSKFDDFEFVAIGISACEEFPPDGNERGHWTRRHEMIEEIHHFEDGARSPYLFGEVLFDHSEGEGSCVTESESDFCFPKGGFDAKVIDFGFTPGDGTT